MGPSNAPSNTAGDSKVVVFLGKSPRSCRFVWQFDLEPRRLLVGALASGRMGISRPAAVLSDVHGPRAHEVAWRGTSPFARPRVVEPARIDWRAGPGHFWRSSFPSQLPLPLAGMAQSRIKLAPRWSMVGAFMSAARTGLTSHTALDTSAPRMIHGAMSIGR